MRLSRFENDRNERGSDMGTGWDRNVRRARLFRRSRKEKTDVSESVDIVRFELEDLDVKVFVPARTPLLASMGRRVILPNDNKPIRNHEKRAKIRTRMLTETRTGRRRVQRRVANTPLSGFHTCGVGGGRRACDDENTSG